MKRGLLTLELVIALSLFSLIMSGAVLLSFGGQTAGLDVAMTKEGLWRAFSAIQTDLKASYTAAAYNALASAATTTEASYYQTSRTVTNDSPCIKSVSDAYGWASEHSRSLFTYIESSVVSIAIAQAMGGGCDPFSPSGDWENPDTYGSIDVSGADGTGVDARWIGGHRYAFVSADPSAVAKEDLYIYNVEDPQAPVLVSATSTGKGLNGIAIGGSYAYVLNNDNNNQLQIIDISDPANPEFIKQVALPNVVFTCIPASDPCLAGRSIAYYDNHVYIGTQYFAFGTPPLENNEFHIFDVSTPSTPVWVGSLDVDHNVNSITVSGDYAYLATSADYAELTMVDITTPGSMTLPPDYTDPAVMNMKYNARTHVAVPGASTEDGIAVTVVGNMVYVGRERVSGATERDYYILDAANTNALAHVGSLKLDLGPGSEVSGIATVGSYSYVITTDSNDPFFVINVAIPTVPSIQSTCGLNFSQVTRALVYLDNLIFTVNRSNDILRIIWDRPGSSCS